MGLNRPQYPWFPEFLMQEYLRIFVPFFSLVSLGAALLCLFLAWQWSKEPALGWLGLFLTSLAGIECSLMAGPDSTLWIAGFSQVLYLVSLPGLMLSLTSLKVSWPFVFLYGVFSLFLILAMESPWRLFSGLEAAASVGAFTWTGFCILFLGIRLRRLKNPLPRRLFHRFLLVSLLLLPLMLCDSLGSLAGWTWILGFDQLTLPFYLLAISVLVVSEAAKWLKALAQSPQEQPSAPGESPMDLSPRLKEIAEKLLEGLSSKEIAHQLHISPKTAENHIYSLYKKVGAKSRVQFYYIYKKTNPATPPSAR